MNNLLLQVQIKKTIILHEKIKTKLYIVYSKPIWNIKCKKVTNKMIEKRYYANTEQKKAGAAPLTSCQPDFRIKTKMNVP